MKKWFFFVLIFPVCLLSYEKNLRITPVVKAIQTVKSSVVNISTDQVMKVSDTGLLPFDFMIKHFFSIPKEYVSHSLGSGFIISGGYVVTNYHVVEAGKNIKITFLDGKTATGEIVGYSANLDIALIKISDLKTSSVILGDSSNLLQGETVIAIGDPIGLSNTVTVGIVSALNRKIKVDKRLYFNIIQTDASINPGNSGGPLVNVLGEVIGINTAVASSAQGIGFAIPVNILKRILPFLKKGDVPTGFLGVKIQSINNNIKKSFKYNYDNGVIINDIKSNSSSDNQLRRGDFIQNVGGVPIEEPFELQNILSSYPPGSKILLKIWRKGKILSVTRKTNKYSNDLLINIFYKKLGIKELNFNKRAIKIDKINKKSILKKFGIRKNDKIAAIDGVVIKSEKELSLLLEKIRFDNYITFSIVRRYTVYTIQVPIEPIDNSF